MKVIFDRKNILKYSLWLYVFALLPIFGVGDLQNTLGEWVYHGWQVLSMCILLFILSQKLDKIRLNWFSVLFIVYRAFLFVSTLKNTGFSAGILVMDICVICLLLLLPEDKTLVLEACSMIATAVILANFFSLYVHDFNALGEAIYFIGGKNTLSIKLVPCMFFILLHAQFRYQKLRVCDICFVVLALYSIYFGKSGVGAIVLAAALLGLILFAIWKKPRKSLFIGGIVIVCVLLVGFLDKLVDNKLWIKVTEILNKSSTLTARQGVWEQAVEVFKEHPIFGFGRKMELNYISDWGEDRTVYETHNILLQVLVEGGIVGLCLYAAILFLAFKNLQMHREIDKLLFLASCLMLVNGLGESVNHQAAFVLLLFFAYYSSHFKPEERSLYGQ